LRERCLGHPALAKSGMLLHTGATSRTICLEAWSIIHKAVCFALWSVGCLAVAGHHKLTVPSSTNGRVELLRAGARAWAPSCGGMHGGQSHRRGVARRWEVGVGVGADLVAEVAEVLSTFLYETTGFYVWTTDSLVGRIRISSSTRG
jgi:hypothetical protein